MEILWNWLAENYQWLFGGVGGAAVVGLIGFFLKRMLSRRQQPAETKENAGGDNISTQGDYSPGKVGGDYIVGDKVGRDKIVHHDQPISQQPKKEKPRKILVLAANPKKTNQLRLDEEIREIDQGLRRSKYRERFELKQRWALRIDDLRHALLDESPQIVHFSGHGYKISSDVGEKIGRDLLYKGEDNGDSGIVLEDEQGHSTKVNKKALTKLIEILADGIECVVLNACYTEDQAEEIARHIPYVVGMRKAIGDKAAIQFSIGFYDGIGAGKSIETAFELGCNAIQLKEIPEALTPVLKKRT